MNIYARYFDQDVLVYSFEELMDFLASIPEIPINQHMIDDVRMYVESDIPYPKRYKIRPRVYFILIKTTAQTMEEFKANRKDNSVRQMPEVNAGVPEMVVNKKEIKAALLAEERFGWYLGTIVFKRVIQIANTAKFRYQDTTFQAYVQAESGMECYNRIVDHLKGRSEVDLRSQFPSARGVNFSFEYVGENLPEEEGSDEKYADFEE
ncbi:putative uncharacterized protein [Prevotella sp. CAG:891]|jgi:hypothetical protein|nr:hypothetical protein [Prevotellamassilia sp.]CDE85880.1 putative uncharacterized protein [Prevotella sp. CAG:891]